jgi:hypothetical protein
MQAIKTSLMRSRRLYFDALHKALNVGFEKAVHL